ncbi:MAG: 5-formyltetrahydrofolate cyclo-ligase [Candidatus Omnitrophota bacterium]|nr:5-formyltetrahydrofolate cyclo-ligase [Candidatus Omnitrophota bacterium]
MENRFPFIIRIISAILVATFLAQDVAWSYPDKLAPQSFFNTPGARDSASGLFIERLIEKDSAFHSKILLPAIIHILESNELSKYLADNNITYNCETTSDGQISEILIYLPGYILRYYDPSLPKYPNEVKFSNFKNISKQILKSSEISPADAASDINTIARATDMSGSDSAAKKVRSVIIGMVIFVAVVVIGNETVKLLNVFNGDGLFDIYINGYRRSPFWVSGLTASAEGAAAELVGYYLARGEKEKIRSWISVLRLAGVFLFRLMVLGPTSALIDRAIEEFCPGKGNYLQLRLAMRASLSLVHGVFLSSVVNFLAPYLCFRAEAGYRQKEGKAEEADKLRNDYSAEKQLKRVWDSIRLRIGPVIIQHDIIQNIFGYELAYKILSRFGLGFINSVYRSWIANLRSRVNIEDKAVLGFTAAISLISFAWGSWSVGVLALALEIAILLLAGSSKRKAEQAISKEGEPLGSKLTVDDPDHELETPGYADNNIRNSASGSSEAFRKTVIASELTLLTLTSLISFSIPSLAARQAAAKASTIPGPAEFTKNNAHVIQVDRRAKDLKVGVAVANNRIGAKASLSQIIKSAGAIGGITANYFITRIPLRFHPLGLLMSNDEVYKLDSLRRPSLITADDGFVWIGIPDVTCYLSIEGKTAIKNMPIHMVNGIWKNGKTDLVGVYNSHFDRRTIVKDGSFMADITKDGIVNAVEGRQRIVTPAGGFTAVVSRKGSSNKLISLLSEEGVKVTFHVEFNNKELNGKRVASAVMTGPWAVEAGRVAIKNKGGALKTWSIAALSKSDKLMLITVTNPTTRYNAAQKAFKLGAKNAIFMDSGSSTAYKWKKRLYQKGPVPQALVVSLEKSPNKNQPSDAWYKYLFEKKPEEQQQKYFEWLNNNPWRPMLLPTGVGRRNSASGISEVDPTESKDDLSLKIINGLNEIIDALPPVNWRLGNRLWRAVQLIKSSELENIQLARQVLNEVKNDRIVRKRLPVIVDHVIKLEDILREELGAGSYIADEKIPPETFELPFEDGGDFKLTPPSDGLTRKSASGIENIPFIEEAIARTEEVSIPTRSRKATLRINAEIINELSERDLKKITDVVTNNYKIKKNERSLEVELQDPITHIKGERLEYPITMIQIKGVVFDSRKKPIFHMGSGDRKNIYVAHKTGIILHEPYEGMPQGGNYLARAVNEFVKTYDMRHDNNINKKVIAKYPVGWGEFYAYGPFVDRYGKKRKLGFVILGGTKEMFDRSAVDGLGTGRALKVLHENGYAAHFMHPQNITCTEDENLSFIHDLDVLKNRRDNMAKEEMIACQFVDFWYALLSQINAKSELLDVYEEDPNIRGNGFLPGYVTDKERVYDLQNTKLREIEDILARSATTPIQNIDHAVVRELKKNMELAGLADWGLGYFSKSGSRHSASGAEETARLKQDIRTDILSALKAQPAEDRIKKNNAIASRFFRNNLYVKAKSIFIYVSKEEEVDTIKIIEKALKDGKTVYLPRIIDGTRLEIVKINKIGDLVKGKFGILEPNPKLRSEKGADIDLMVLPLVGFDKDCNRLGRGGGYFDIFLAEFNAKKDSNNLVPKIGLAFDLQYRESIPVSESDAPLDYVLSEDRRAIRPGAIIYRLQHPPDMVKDAANVTSWEDAGYSTFLEDARKVFRGWHNALMAAGIEPIPSKNKPPWQGRYTDWEIVKKIVPHRISKDGTLRRITHKELSSLVDEVGKGNAAARQAIVDAYLWLVEKAVKARMENNPDINLEPYKMDLIAAGTMGYSAKTANSGGLTRAVELYDLRKNYEFSKYAWQWISSSIQRKIDAIRKDELLAAYLAAAPPSSVSAESTPSDTIQFNGETLPEIMGRIGVHPHNQKIFIAYHSGMTQEDIGRKIGGRSGKAVTKERISQIIQNITKKIRNAETEKAADKALSPLERLTDKEKEAVRLISEGRKYDDIAKIFECDNKTFYRLYVYRIYNLLGVKSSIQLFRKLIELGHKIALPQTNIDMFLTAKEERILELFLEGKKTEEIASDIGIPVENAASEVSYYGIERINAKWGLNAKDGYRTDLFLEAVKRGYITISPILSGEEEYPFQKFVIKFNGRFERSKIINPYSNTTRKRAFKAAQSRGPAQENVSRDSASGVSQNDVWQNNSPAREDALLSKRIDVVGKMLADSGLLVKTPLLPMKRLSDITGKDVRLLNDGPEQTTSSFKIRGVAAEVEEAIRERIEEMKKYPSLCDKPFYIVTQTDGNHGIAMIEAVRFFVEKYKKQYSRYPRLSGGIKRIEPKIFTILSLPPVKLDKMNEMLSHYRQTTGNMEGGEIKNTFANYEEAKEARELFVKEHIGSSAYMEHGGLTIMAGHASAATDIDEQLKVSGIGDNKRIVVLIPVGAGGPIGIGAGLKLKRKNAKAIAVQTRPYSAFVRALITGKMEKNERNPAPTAVINGKNIVYEDGIAVNGPEPEAERVAKSVFDAAVIVDDKLNLTRAAPLMYLDLKDANVGGETVIGGTTAITGEALLEYYKSLDIIKDADVIVLFAPEGNIDPDITAYIRKLSEAYELERIQKGVTPERSSASGETQNGFGERNNDQYFNALISRKEEAERCRHTASITKARQERVRLYFKALNICRNILEEDPPTGIRIDASNIIGYVAKDMAQFALLDLEKAVAAGGKAEEIEVLYKELKNWILRVACPYFQDVITNYDHSGSNNISGVPRACAGYSFAMSVKTLADIAVSDLTIPYENPDPDKPLRHFSISLGVAIKGLRVDHDNDHAQKALKEASVVAKKVIAALHPPADILAAENRRMNLMAVMSTIQSAGKVAGMKGAQKDILNNIKDEIMPHIEALNKLIEAKEALPEIFVGIAVNEIDGITTVEYFREYLELHIAEKYGRFIEVLKPVFLNWHYDYSDVAIVHVLGNRANSSRESWRITELLAEVRKIDNKMTRESLEKRVSRGYSWLGIEPVVTYEKDEETATHLKPLGPKHAKEHLDKDKPAIQNFQLILEKLKPWLGDEKYRRMRIYLNQLCDKIGLFETKLEAVLEENKPERRQQEDLAAFYEGGQSASQGIQSGYKNSMDAFAHKLDVRLSEIVLPRISGLQRAVTGYRDRAERLQRLAPQAMEIRSLYEHLIEREGKTKDLTDKACEDYLSFGLYRDIFQELSDLREKLEILEREAARLKTLNNLIEEIRSLKGFFASGNDKAIYDDIEQRGVAAAGSSRLFDMSSSKDMSPAQEPAGEESVTQIENSIKYLRQKKAEILLDTAWPAFLAIEKFLFSERMRLAGIDDKYHIAGTWQQLDEAEDIVCSILTADLSSGNNEPWKNKIRRLRSIIFDVVYNKGYNAAYTNYLSGLSSGPYLGTQAALISDQGEENVWLGDTARRQILSDNNRLGHFGFFFSDAPQNIDISDVILLSEALVSNFITATSLPDLSEISDENIESIAAQTNAIFRAKNSGAESVMAAERGTWENYAKEYVRICSSYAKKYPLEVQKEALATKAPMLQLKWGETVNPEGDPEGVADLRRSASGEEETLIQQISEHKINADIPLNLDLFLTDDSRTLIFTYSALSDILKPAISYNEGLSPEILQIVRRSSPKTTKSSDDSTEQKVRRSIKKIIELYDNGILEFFGISKENADKLSGLMKDYAKLNKIGRKPSAALMKTYSDLTLPDHRFFDDEYFKTNLLNRINAPGNANKAPIDHAGLGISIKSIGKKIGVKKREDDVRKVSAKVKPRVPKPVMQESDIEITLTEEEAEILGLLVDGNSSKDVQGMLSIPNAKVDLCLTKVYQACKDKGCDFSGVDSKLLTLRAKIIQGRIKIKISERPLRASASGVTSSDSSSVSREMSEARNAAETVSPEKRKFLDMFNNPPPGVTDRRNSQLWTNAGKTNVPNSGRRLYGSWQAAVTAGGLIPLPSTRKPPWVEGLPDQGAVDRIMRGYRDDEGKIRKLNDNEIEEAAEGLYEEIRKGNAIARDTLMKISEDFVRRIVRIYIAKNPSLKSYGEDLFTAGRTGHSVMKGSKWHAGLMRAAELYVPGNGTKFKTYSWWWIKQAVERKGKPILKEIERIAMSLDSPSGKEDNGSSQATGHETIADRDAADPVKRLLDMIGTNGVSAEDALNLLSPYEQKIFLARYAGEMSLEKIGKKIGSMKGKPAKRQAIHHRLGIISKKIKEASSSPLDRIDKEQKELIKYIMKGMTAVEIAELNDSTSKNVLDEKRALFAVFGVKNEMQLLARLIKLGYDVELPAALSSREDGLTELTIIEEKVLRLALAGNRPEKISLKLHGVSVKDVCGTIRSIGVRWGIEKALIEGKTGVPVFYEAFKKGYLLIAPIEPGDKKIPFQCFKILFVYHNPAEAKSTDSDSGIRLSASGDNVLIGESSSVWDLRLQEEEIDWNNIASFYLHQCFDADRERFSAYMYTGHSFRMAGRINGKNYTMWIGPQYESLEDNTGPDEAYRGHFSFRDYQDGIDFSEAYYCKVFSDGIIASSLAANKEELKESRQSASGAAPKEPLPGESSQVSPLHQARDRYIEESRQIVGELGVLWDDIVFSNFLLEIAASDIIKEGDNDPEILAVIRKIKGASFEITSHLFDPSWRLDRVDISPRELPKLSALNLLSIKKNQQQRFEQFNPYMIRISEAAKELSRDKFSNSINEKIKEMKSFADELVVKWDTMGAYWGRPEIETTRDGPGDATTDSPKRQSASGDVPERLAKVRGLLEEGSNTHIVKDGAKVLLSENLFIKDGDRTELDEALIALKPALDSGHISIMKPEDIRVRSMNAKITRNNMAIVMTTDDFNNKEIWNGSDKETSVRASILILDDKLTGSNYLYLEGVMGLAGALMINDKQAISAYYKILSGVTIDDAILKLLDNDSENNMAFAINAILKFKLIEKIAAEEFSDYRKKMEEFLINA